MDNPSDALLPQLQQLRQLFAEAAPSDPKVISDYAWIIAKALIREHEALGSVECRQLLAEYLRLPVERPSRLHSAILFAAIKVANTYPDFRFAVYLNMWGIGNLRPEDQERPPATAPGQKSYSSLAERAARALAHSLLLHPEDQSSAWSSLLDTYGLSIRPMLVTRVREVTGKEDGRKYRFVTLTSPDGFEAESIAHTLRPSPLRPLPEGKRHYVNIGQFYYVLLHNEKVAEAYVSPTKALDTFPTAIGYIESLDTTHGHMHIYDQYSRHFVAHIQRFSKETAGTFVRFVPIVPQTSKFKTAIILATIPTSSEDVQRTFTDIRITSINKENSYAAWELVDKEHPITELLSPLQLSEGEQSPSFTSGFVSLDSSVSTIPLSEGWEGRAFIYLRRGKDHQKRPRIAIIS